MAKFEVHCQDCMDQLGDRFEQVNSWLDELFSLVGSGHRDIRHNEKGVEKVRQMWGDEAAKAAEIHISKDEGCIPKIDLTFQMRLAMKPHIHQAFIKEYEDEESE